MIRLVLQTLANQNEPAGYEAETRLAELIYSRFEHIHWTNADFREISGIGCPVRGRDALAPGDDAKARGRQSFRMPAMAYATPRYGHRS